eukprot:gene12070-13988_t
MRNTNTGKALSYGFISFMNNECAASAMEKLNGISLHGRSMRIGWAAHNLKTHKTEEPAIINSVYIRFITPKTSEYVTEEVIHRAFDQFGSVVDVSIKQSAVDQRSGRQSGYGFVHFSADHAGIIAAFDALSRMNNNTYDGVTYSVEPSKNLLRQMDEMNLGVPGNRGPRANQPGAAPSQYQQHQPQQSLYDRGMPLQSRMEPQYRPHQHHQQQQQGRDDFHQMSKLYQQQPPPSHMNHQGHHQQQQHGRYGQGMNQTGNTMYASGNASRYDVSGPGSNGQGYGVSSAPYPPRQQQQQPQFEPHAHRYAPQHAPHSTAGLQQQQPPYGRQASQQEPLHSGNSMLPSSFGGEDLYGRPHSNAQSSDPLSLSVLTSGPAQGPSLVAQGHGPSPRAISQTMSSSPSAGKSHVRNSSRDLDFASAVLAPTDEYVSSYVIEKPAIDDRYFDAPSKEPVPVPAPSSYSYGQNGSPPAFGEKHLASSAELQHQAHGAAAYTADRRGGLSSNSQSLYSHLPAGSVRPPHVPALAQQQLSRRPVNVTDLEIGRSRSMSSAGLPTSQDSLFNYMDSKASSFALPGPPYDSPYTSQGLPLKDGCAAAGYPHQDIRRDSGAHPQQNQQQNQQQQHFGSEMDELTLEAKNLSLAYANNSSGSSTARSSLSEDKKSSPKSRQLPVTHFFKPVGAV